ncbi:NHLP leader peptide family RiPP precursor [Paenibacillus mendelii]|uniref:NHLP leader peptide family RiPP n=1 Tax=Paenibacillus mendelii TaxID=206163 RepID=A0ABV6JCI1_9BACL|nr:NHLP leader peptide family RiPP precursor [Paenibacillus mendelii]MCQ6562722.1 NHLP leader peptide family RiPP precursor [Paenibacillus mendelii]
MDQKQELYNQIIEKAWSDAAFKAKLLADPHAAILESFNVEIPADIQLTALEETPTKFYIVIPPNPEVSAPNGQW